MSGRKAAPSFLGPLPSWLTRPRSFRGFDIGEAAPTLTTAEKRDRERLGERRRYAARAAAGLCRKCGARPPAQGLKWCRSCRDQNNQARRIARAQRRDIGFCVECDELAMPGRSRCRHHLHADSQRERGRAPRSNKESRRRSRRRLYWKRRALRQCTNCGDPAGDKSLCPPCMRDHCMRAARKRARRKKEGQP